MNQSIPIANDADDTRETIAALVSPESRRFVDIVAWQADPAHYPSALIADATAWLKGYATRERRTLNLDLADYAVAVAALCRRDGALYGDGAAPSGALAAGVGALCGFLLCLGLVILGHWLGALRGV